MSVHQAKDSPLFHKAKPPRRHPERGGTRRLEGLFVGRDDIADVEDANTFRTILALFGLWSPSVSSPTAHGGYEGEETGEEERAASLFIASRPLLDKLHVKRVSKVAICPVGATIFFTFLGETFITCSKATNVWGPNQLKRRLLHQAVASWGRDKVPPPPQSVPCRLLMSCRIFPERIK